MNLKVIYKLYNDINKLTVEYEGRSDSDTLLNLSNHAYFNLSGNSKYDILNHELYINASKMERIEKLIPKEIQKHFCVKDLVTCLKIKENEARLFIWVYKKMNLIEEIEKKGNTKYYSIIR